MLLESTHGRLGVSLTQVNVSTEKYGGGVAGDVGPVSNGGAQETLGAGEFAGGGKCGGGVDKER